MKNIKHAVSTIILFCALTLLPHTGLYAKGKDSVLITPFTSLGDIGWITQFTFIHAKPLNKVDVWAKKFKPFGSYDSIQLKKMIIELGAIKSKEAYTLLYLFCCMPMVIKHLTAFNSIHGSIQAYGGYQALNRYFLNNEVSSKLSTNKFNEEVRKRCTQRHPLCYYWN